MTIADLADRLGLSKSSVSYALNDRPGVSDETRRRVLDLADELDWHPSSSARALSNKRSDTIGLVVRRDPEMLSTEPFFVRVLAGMEAELERADGALLLRITDDPERERAIYRQWWRSDRVAGFICLDQHVDDPRPRLLTSLGAPAVFVGAPSTDPSQPHVLSPEAEDSETLVGHLADLGHRHLGHVGGPIALSHERIRHDTVAAAARRRGLRLTYVGADYSKADGQRAVGELLDRPDAPTAIITGNDLMAVGAVHAVRARRLTSPGDLAIAAWDDSFLCQLVDPRSPPWTAHLARWAPWRPGRSSTRSRSLAWCSRTAGPPRACSSRAPRRWAEPATDPDLLPTEPVQCILACDDRTGSVRSNQPTWGSSPLGWCTRLIPRLGVSVSP
ncbi:LacI family DNA-binding transcriptional regulator [Arsenicicoccus piscis]|uniref:LacI family DNA-binding transcriptional regulator n=1 Tax=Arsenicicoccus piscis TaxID=673954 RepID=UPI0024E15F37|nr:LacI family DNA-binding transcriptional regulator [Arsenicicoccus piscis]